MLNCYGCINKNTNACRGCVGWDQYESNTLINPVLAMDIDKEMKMLAKHALNKIFGVESSERRENNMKIKKVIFNAPATVVLWEDGAKTIVKSGEGDIYDPEKGLAMAIAKKALGNKGNYYKVFKKWLPDEEFEYLCNRIKLIQAIDECFGCPEDTVGITVTSDDILFEQSDGSKIGFGFKDIVSKFTGDKKEVERFEEAEESEIQWLSVREVAEANGLSVECVRKQIKDGFIPLAEKVDGKWKIPCYVFDDHVEVKCM